MPKSRMTVAAGVILGLLAADFAESAAEAKFLRQGVRPGSSGGGKSLFLRAPPDGTRVSIVAPGETRPRKPAAAPMKRQMRHDWFWKAHSPAGNAAGAARWAEALQTMQARRAKGQGIFHVDTIRAIRAAWGREVAAAARKRNLSEALLLAVIAVESAGKPRALSPKGAQGLMQLIPATAARFGVRNAFEPAANIAGGAAYLDWLLAEFRDDILLALAGYNAGEGAVHKHDGVPPYAETRDYVVLVLDAIAAASALCDELPAGPRLPCRWKPEV